MSAEFDTMCAMEMRRRIAAKEISPVELTRRALTKAEATQSTLNAFYLLMPEEALAAAKVAEDEIQCGDGRRARSGARQSRWGHFDRQDHNERVRVQASRRQPAHRRHPQSMESGQDTGRFE